MSVQCSPSIRQGTVLRDHSGRFTGRFMAYVSSLSFSSLPFVLFNQNYVFEVWMVLEYGCGIFSKNLVLY